MRWLTVVLVASGFAFVSSDDAKAEGITVSAIDIHVSPWNPRPDYHPYRPHYPRPHYPSPYRPDYRPYHPRPYPYRPYRPYCPPPRPHCPW